MSTELYESLDWTRLAKPHDAYWTAKVDGATLVLWRFRGRWSVRVRVSRRRHLEAHGYGNRRTAELAARMLIALLRLELAAE